MGLNRFVLLLLLSLLNDASTQSQLTKIEAEDVTTGNDENSEITMRPYCDLAENACDPECCHDKDCSLWEKNSFHCEEKINDARELQSEYHEKECDRSERDPILCLHHSNSPYLGKFYPEPEIAKDPANIPIRTAFNLKSSRVDDSPSQLTGEIRNLVPTNVLGRNGFCILRPIRRFIDSKSNCMYTLSEDTCINNSRFNISQYASHELLSIYNNNSSNITLVPEVICVRNGTNYVTLSKNIFQSKNTRKENLNEYKTCDVNKYTILNEKTKTCENVVVGLEYIFNTNTSLITSGKLKVTLADIPITLESFASALNLTYTSEEDQTFLYVSQGVHLYFNTNESKIEKDQGYRFNELMSEM